MKAATKKGLDVSDSVKRVTPKSTGKCPICGKQTQIRSRPFCSPRCANIDLGRWLSDAYFIAAVDEGISPGEKS